MKTRNIILISISVVFIIVVTLITQVVIGFIKYGYNEISFIGNKYENIIDESQMKLKGRYKNGFDEIVSLYSINDKYQFLMWEIPRLTQILFIDQMIIDKCVISQDSYSDYVGFNTNMTPSFELKSKRKLNYQKTDSLTIKIGNNSELISKKKYKNYVFIDLKLNSIGLSNNKDFNDFIIHSSRMYIHCNMIIQNKDNSLYVMLLYPLEEYDLKEDIRDFIIM